MIFVREASAAVVLVMLTLSLQCAGMAALISFAKPSLAPDDLRLGPIRSALLMVRLMTAFIVLHIFEILLWAALQLREQPSLGRQGSGGEVSRHNSCVALVRVNRAFRVLFL